jgi:hypothetical protein
MIKRSNYNWKSAEQYKYIAFVQYWVNKFEARQDFGHIETQMQYDNQLPGSQ